MLRNWDWTYPLKSNIRAIVCLLVILFAAQVPVSFAEKEDENIAHLYFADANGSFLIAEARVMANLDDPTRRGRWVVEQLIEGPSRGGLPTIPAGTALRAFYLLDDGTAIVDLSPHFRDNHPGGCRMEQLTIFCVVNSLVLNIPEIRRVKILIDGAEAQTLAGHITLAFPLTADMLLTR